MGSNPTTPTSLRMAPTENTFRLMPFAAVDNAGCGDLDPPRRRFASTVFLIYEGSILVSIRARGVW